MRRRQRRRARRSRRRTSPHKKRALTSHPPQTELRVLSIPSISTPTYSVPYASFLQCVFRPGVVSYEFARERLKKAYLFGWVGWPVAFRNMWHTNTALLSFLFLFLLLLLSLFFHMMLRILASLVCPSDLSACLSVCVSWAVCCRYVDSLNNYRARERRLNMNE